MEKDVIVDESMIAGAGLGQVLALADGAPHVEAIAGMGLAGERHADPLSPRQVLLAGAPAYADFELSTQALGENLLVDFDTSRLVSGSVLRIGEAVLLRLMFQCEACGHLDAFQAGVAARIGRRRGVLARVLAGGVIRPGDRIRDLGRMLPAWDEDWRLRVARVLRAAPDGMVLSHARLARLAGVQSSYCRAFPRLLKSLGLAGKAVSSQAAVGLRCWDGEGLFDDEGGYSEFSS